MCTIFVVILYFKLRFDQINQQVKSLILLSKCKVINVRREKVLTYLIHQHNLASIEMSKINKLFRRSAASMFFILSISKIITLFLVINLNHFIAKLMLLLGFIIIFFFGFGISYLFSLQINSAHKSSNLIHSVICKYKMRFGFRLKVKNIHLKVEKCSFLFMFNNFNF